MMCQDCGWRLEVVKTMVLEAVTQRLRECRCGSRFLTTESVTKRLPVSPVTSRQPPGNSSPQSSSSGSVISPFSEADQTRARVERIVRSFAVAGKDAPPWGLTETFRKKLTEAYPGVDAEAEFAKVDVWAEANPHKRKTPRGMKAFLMRWFDRAQNNATRAPVQKLADPRCAYHRAPGTGGKPARGGPFVGCPECKHVSAASASRRSEPTRIDEGPLPAWAGRPASPEQIDELRAARKAGAGG